MEKHFPSPDRTRMSRLLGLAENSKELREIMEDARKSPPPPPPVEDKGTPGRAKRKPGGSHSRASVS